jgi:hypothetical protein
MHLAKGHVWTLLLSLAMAGCAVPSGDKPRPTQTVHAVGKVIESLTGETTRRSATDDYRGLPVIVSPAGAGGGGIERMVTEFLRTRLHESGMVVQTTCAVRCMEITLQEFSTSEPAVSQLTPGQILTVATGGVPILSSLTRSLTERERELERAAARTTGLLVTFAAREGERFTARSHVIAIVSTSSGDVALEQK